MSTLSPNDGWGTLSRGSDEAEPPPQPIMAADNPAVLTKTSNWCNLIGILQASRIKGCNVTIRGSQDPVGNGTYFAVWRHEIKGRRDQLAYQDQNGKVLRDGTTVALKRVIPRIDPDTCEIDLGDKRLFRAVALELQALSMADLRNHENIITLFGFVWEPRDEKGLSWPTLVLEYCDFNLSEYQQGFSDIAVDQLLNIGRGIGRGLSVIHSHFMVHGDVKSENVLISVRNLQMPIPKLCDFGCSLFDQDLNEEWNIRDKMRIGGTDPWRAPECVEHGGWVLRQDARATDLYSYGLLWCRLMHNDKDPFVELSGEETNSEDKERLKRSGRLAALAQNDLLSIAPTDPNIESVADLVYALLQATCSTRLNALRDFRRRNPKQDFLSEFDNSGTNVQNIDTDSFLVKIGRRIRSSPMVIIEELCQWEMLDEVRRLNEATRAKIFGELLGLVEELKNRIPICPGCCAFTVFDQVSDRQTPILQFEDYVDAIQAQVDNHTCNFRFPSILDGLFNLFGMFDSRPYLQLIACFVDGYGTKRDPDRALSYVLDFAERGVAGCQHDLATFFLALDRPLPVHVPVRKWMVSGVVHGALGGAALALGKVDSALLQVAKHIRAQAYDGITLATLQQVEIETEESAALAKSYTRLHREAGSWTEPLESIRRLCKRNFWTNMPSLFFKRSPTCDINQTSANGETPLLLACRAQRHSSIRLLLSLGADVNAAEKNTGATALHWLSLMEDCGDLIGEIIARGADINAQTRIALTGLPWLLGGICNAMTLLRMVGTPLLWAVATENHTTVRALVKNGADIDLASPNGLSPLQTAVEIAQKELVECLLQVKPQTYRISRIVFYQLIAKPTTIRRCYNQRTEDAQVQVTRILTPYCPRANFGEVFEFFSFIIPRTIRCANFKLLEAILDSLDSCLVSCGAFPGSPLTSTYWEMYDLWEIAVRRDDAIVLKLVLRKGCSMPSLALHFLAETGGGSDCIQTLLNHGLALNCYNPNTPLTPFGLALVNGNVNTCEALASFMSSSQLSAAVSADGSIKLDNGRCFTLLGAAIFFQKNNNSHTDGVEYLFSLPKHLNAVNFMVEPRACRSALHLALSKLDLNDGFFEEFGSLALFRYLLVKFNEPQYINARDSLGFTPLHASVFMAKFEECQLLVEAGAELDLIAEKGKTAFDYCFAEPPPVMVKSESDHGPTKEMTCRFENRRNACAAYLRKKGARSGLYEIVSQRGLPEDILPFPHR